MAKTCMPILLLALIIALQISCSYSFRPRVRCPHISLPNGRVVIRSRGRIAKLRCLKGFTRVEGDRFATCIQQQWNGKIPKCIKNGCGSVNPPSFGHREYLYRRGMAMFSCSPGYLLLGSPAISCDSVRWNASAPTCEANQNPQYFCDFEENGTCGWVNSNRDDFDWVRKRGPAQQVFSAGSGPGADHTLGTPEGHYMYIEASIPRPDGHRALLYSPVYTPLAQLACFSFFVHMYGHSSGSMNVYVKPEGESVNFLPPVMQMSGSSEARWFFYHLNITSVFQKFQIVLEAVRNEASNDIAIDDVKLAFNEDCYPVTTTTTTQPLTTTTTPTTTQRDISVHDTTIFDYSTIDDSTIDYSTPFDYDTTTIDYSATSNDVTPVSVSTLISTIINDINESTTVSNEPPTTTPLIIQNVTTVVIPAITTTTTSTTTTTTKPGPKPATTPVLSDMTTPKTTTILTTPTTDRPTSTENPSSRSVIITTSIIQTSINPSTVPSHPITFPITTPQVATDVTTESNEGPIKITTESSEGPTDRTTATNESPTDITTYSNEGSTDRTTDSNDISDKITAVTEKIKTTTKAEIITKPPMTTSLGDIGKETDQPNPITTSKSRNTVTETTTAPNPKIDGGSSGLSTTSIVVIIIVVIATVAFIATGIYVYRCRNQDKLADDSDTRYLATDEVQMMDSLSSTYGGSWGRGGARV